MTEHHASFVSTGLPSWRDAIGLILEFDSTKEIDKIFEYGRLDETRMDFRYTVHSVAAHNGQMRHADLLDRAFLDDRHARKSIEIVWKHALHLLQKVQVDVIDNHHMSSHVT